MELVLLIAAAAALAWWAICTERVDPWILLAAFAAGGYVLGPPLWSPHVGPVTLTADRMLLAGLAAAAAWHWRQGRLKCGTIIGADWLVSSDKALLKLNRKLVGRYRILKPEQALKELQAHTQSLASGGPIAAVPAPPG